MNSELPPASEVSGLKDFLELVFTVPPTADPPPPEPSPSPEPEPSPSPEPATTLQVADPVVNPAPVVQSATLSSSISAAARVTIEIRSPKNQLVQTLVTDAALQSGYIEAHWDRRDARGRKVKGGNYVALVVAVAADGTVVRSQTTFYAQ